MTQIRGAKSGKVKGNRLAETTKIRGGAGRCRTRVRIGIAIVAVVAQRGTNERYIGNPSTSGSARLWVT